MNPAPLVAIVGGGFAGVALAVHLLRRSAGPLRLVVVDPAATLGAGIAYATQDPNHRLNVPAAAMTVFQERPRHFYEWLLAHAPQAIDDDAQAPDGAVYVARRFYGAYVAALLAHAVAWPGRAADFAHRRARAVALGRRGERLRVALDDGQHVDADVVALCLGNARPRPFAAFAALADDPRYVGDPWDEAALARIDPARPLLAIGTGLTMADVAVSALAAGRRAPIYAVSRRGLLPHCYPPIEPGALPDPARYSATAMGALRRVRQDCAAASREGRDWRVPITVARKLAIAIWERFDDAEKRRFFRHLRPYYESHRFRMAPCIWDRLRAAIERRQLRIVAGRIVAAAAGPDGLTVTVERRRGAGRETVVAGTVVNCTGPDQDIAAADDPFVASLRREGFVRPHPTGVGFDGTAEDRMVGPRGGAAPLYALGALTKGYRGEVTAVHDISRQAVRLADHLVARLALGPRAGAALP